MRESLVELVSKCGEYMSARERKELFVSSVLLLLLLLIIIITQCLFPPLYLLCFGPCQLI
jgi:hypothetical protein